MVLQYVGQCTAIICTAAIALLLIWCELLVLGGSCTSVLYLGQALTRFIHTSLGHANNLAWRPVALHRPPKSCIFILGGTYLYKVVRPPTLRKRELHAPGCPFIQLGV
jgi:hypothetical protein